MIDFFGRKFRKNVQWHKDNDSERPAVDWAKSTGEECELSADASLVISLTGRVSPSMAFNGATNEFAFGEYPAHAPVIDLDGPHHYEPSTTPGHGHLYLNKDMAFEDMMEVLTVLTKHGIVQPGFTEAARIRGWAAVRTPWTPKDASAV